MKLAKKRREQLILYAPLFIWIGVIFFLSSGQGSMSRTSLIIRPILEFLFPAADEHTLTLYHAYIRKFAHFAEYAVLALLAMRAVSRSTTAVLRQWAIAASISLVLFVAVADEINQSFNESRTASPLDVLLDLAGGLTAAVVIWGFRKWRPKPETC